MAVKAKDIMRKKDDDKKGGGKVADWIAGRRKHLTSGASKLSSKKRSRIVKEAEHGHKFRKKGGKGFNDKVKAIEREGHSAESAKKIAGAAFWKERAKAVH